MGWVYAGIASASLAACTCASAQEQVIASLPWLFGQTAGPNGTNYEPPQDDRDLWVIEDFAIAAAANLTRFESWGTVFPAPVQVMDVTVRIYDQLPTEGGQVVISSVVGSGQVVPSGFEYRLRASFGEQLLPAGSYYIAWNASTATSQGKIAIFWAQAGPHAVGGGGADNAWQWNPGGGWGYANNIRPVPAQLGGGGQIGVNFVLYGTPAGCYANCDGSTTPPVLNVADFGCFLGKFAAGDAYANCDGSTTPPVLNVADFGCFLAKFAAGCP